MTAAYPHHARLAGARLKLDRAHEHLVTVQAEADRVTGTNAYALVPYTEDGGRKHLWRVENLKPLDPMFPLWIGDCLHNFRSALDHIAYEAVKHAGLTPTKKTMFPLVAQQPAKPVYVRPDPGPHPDALQIITDMQPYQAGHEHAPLAILDNLDIIDKHRELLATVAGVDLPYYSVPDGMKTLDGWATGDPVVNGQVVMWATVEPAQPVGALEGHVQLCVKLSDGLIPAPFPMAAPVDRLLKDIARQINWTLVMFDWFFASHP